jgi:hypothetical protein
MPSKSKSFCTLSIYTLPRTLKNVNNPCRSALKYSRSYGPGTCCDDTVYGSFEKVAGMVLSFLLTAFTCTAGKVRSSGSVSID